MNWYKNRQRLIAERVLSWGPAEEQLQIRERRANLESPQSNSLWISSVTDGRLTEVVVVVVTGTVGAEGHISDTHARHPDVTCAHYGKSAQQQHLSNSPSELSSDLRELHEMAWHGGAVYSSSLNCVVDLWEHCGSYVSMYVCVHHCARFLYEGFSGSNRLCV